MVGVGNEQYLAFPLITEVWGCAHITYLVNMMEGYEMDLGHRLINQEEKMLRLNPYLRHIYSPGHPVVGGRSPRRHKLTLCVYVDM